MTRQIRYARHGANAAQAYVRNAFKEVLQMVDMMIELLVVSFSWLGKALAGLLPRPKRRERPLQVIGAMSMVNDHVLRDVGLDRSTLGPVSMMSAEEIHGYRTEREVS